MSVRTDPATEVRRRRATPPRAVWGGAAIVVVLVLAYLLSAGQPYLATVVAGAAVYATAATGLDFVVGWLREVSVGQGAAMLVGAYCGVPFLEAGVLVAGLVAAVAGLVTGLVLGLAAVRVKGFALATYTLIVALAVELVFTSVPALGGGVGRPVIADSVVGIPLDTTTTAMLCVVVAILGVLLHARLRRSMTGLAWRGVGLNPSAAGSVAVSPVGARLAAFGLAGVYAGVAGFLFALVSGYLAPTVFGFELAVLMLAMVVIGGRGRSLGAVVGAVVFTVYQQVAPASAYSDAAIGVVLMVVVWFAPAGIVPYVGTGLRRARRRWWPGSPGGMGKELVA
ncbi:branched-chain amino acid ABC transporter permease [Pseudonocardia ailaonensis]|uniref:Branched-chain amino acid ABC transporter permease n=1 Tax=Pseudonocardia ailaonensis TaxID=367279 RepID=A0ABN2N6D5_9PSEU